MHFRTDTNLIVVFCVVSFVRNIGMTSIILFDSAIHAPICLHRSSLLVYVTVTVAESFPLASSEIIEKHNIKYLYNYSNIVCCILFPLQHSN